VKKVGKSPKVAAKNGCNDVNDKNFNNNAVLVLTSLQPFLAATFDFPTFFHPGFLRPDHFFTAWLFLSRFHFFFGV